MDLTQGNSNIVRQYVRSIFRHKGKLLAFNLLMLLLAVAAILLWPRQYQSEAKILIKLGRENSKLDATATTGDTISIQETDREDEIKSVIDIIGSRGVVEQAVEKLGPAVVLGDEPLEGTEEKPKNAIGESFKKAFGTAIDVVKSIDPLTDREEAIQEVIKHIVVEAERKSNVVAVSYETDSPDLAQAVVGALIDQYMIEHARIHQTEGSQEFFSDQLVQLKERVVEKSDMLRKAKDEMGLASVQGHRTYLEDQISEIGSARLAAAQRLAEAKAQESVLETQLASQPKTVRAEERQIPNTGRDTLVAQLQEVQIERAEMQSRLRNDPRLKAILTQERNLKRELAQKTSASRSEFTQALNSIHRDLSLQLAQVKAQVAGFQATLERLDEQKDAAVKKIKGLNMAEIDIFQLERQVTLAVETHRAYADKMEDARIDKELNKSPISNVSLAQAPTLEEKPVSPSKLVVAILTLAGMLFGSLAIIAGLVIVDDSVTRQEDVEALLDTPIILSVPNQREFRHVLN